MKNLSKMALLGILVLMLAMPLAHADITSDLQGYWKFENNLRDETTNMNDGIPVNGFSYVDGYLGKGVHTDSAWSAINVGNGSSLQITGDITISMWIYPEDDSCGTFLISKAPSDYGEYTLFFSTAVCDNYIALFRNSYSSGTGGYPPTGAWTLVTFESNSTDSRIFFNDTMMYEGAGIIADTNSSIPVYIGNLPAETAYGHNVIYDEVRIYNRSLSTDDIGELFYFNGTTPSTTTTTLNIIPITGDITLNNKISYSVCVDNSTLKNAYVFSNGSGTFEKNQLIFCDVGCVTTGNSTAECQPKPLDKALMFIGFVVILFGVLIVILSRVRR